MKYITKNERETIEIGKKIAAKLKGGDILCLYGDLGAGKTTLVKGIAVGLGVKKNIVSPTFAIMKQFDIKTLKHKNIKTLIHIDTYRLKDAQELIDIGAEDYIGAADTICVIEWAEKVEKLLKKKKCVKIHIGHGGKDKREIILN